MDPRLHFETVVAIGAASPYAERMTDATGDVRADSFRRTRDARRAEITEDYLEMIADLIDQTGEARAADLAKSFGVAQATVTKAVARLQREGLVETQPYRSIFLTEEGRAIAARSKARHAVVVNLLTALGVSEETAQNDAEGMEHYVSEETRAAFEAFLRLRKV